MTLFRNNPLRWAVTAVVVVSIAHYGTKLVSSLRAFQLTQTTIAILSILALLFMIMMHHRMDGQLMTHSQEEMALIGIFALFWIVLLVAWKFFPNKHNNASTDLAIHSASQNRDVLTGNDFCSGEGVYCIYEEYAMF